MKLNPTEIKKYDLGALVRNLAQGPDKIMPSNERDFGHALARENQQAGLMSRGTLVPASVFRALTTASGPAGGYSVETGQGEFQDILRPRSLALRLGAELLTGLSGNVSMPTESTSANVQWLPETGTLTRSSLTFGQVALTPHRVAGSVIYGSMLLLQSNQKIAQIVSNDLTRLIGTAIDQAVLSGTGSGGQPLGIVNTSGCQTLTFAGPATEAKLAQFEYAVSVANAEGPAMGWAISPSTRLKLRSASENGTGSQILFRDGTLLGYRAETSTNLSATNQAIFGNWNSVVVGMFGTDAIDMLVDRYTLAANAEIIVTATVETDCAVKTPLSLAFSSDGGNN